jgi:hypothetical protein
MRKEFYLLPGALKGEHLDAIQQRAAHQSMSSDGNDG